MHFIRWMDVIRKQVGDIALDEDAFGARQVHCKRRPSSEVYVYVVCTSGFGIS